MYVIQIADSILMMLQVHLAKCRWESPIDPSHRDGNVSVLVNLLVVMILTHAE